MKNFLSITLMVLVCGVRALAQAPAPGGGGLDYGIEKLFANNPVFSATMQTEMVTPKGSVSFSARMYFDHQNTRNEMNIANIKSASLPAGTVSQMQAIGMDKVVTIIPSDKKTTTIVYPNLRSYTTMNLSTATYATDYKIKSITPSGSETVDGHPSTRNQVVIAMGDQTREFTVWNATDLNNFPIRISVRETQMSELVTFQNVSFNKISGSLFMAPSDYKRYMSIQDLMETAVMAHSPGAGSPPPVLHH